MTMAKLRINGKIIHSKTRQGLEGLLVEAWDRNLFFNDLVGAAVTDQSGQFTLELNDTYRLRLLYDWRLFFDRAPDLYFKVYRGKQLIRSTEDSVLWNVNIGETALTIEVEGIEGGAGEDGEERGRTYTVSGAVTSPTSPSVGGLRVQLVDKNIGPDVLLGETTTDLQGHYQLRVAVPAASLRARRKAHPDLQVRVLVGDKVLAASEIKYNASTTETLDVALPADTEGLPSEYETLTAQLATFFDRHLGELKEDDERQDITFLAHKTGWDARAVAMAALADQFGRRAAPKPFATSAAAKEASLKPAFYYALFRAGYPADAESLYQVNAKTVAAVWEQAIKQGVIPSALADEIPKAAEVFEALSAANSLDVRPAMGVSTLKEMLHDVLGDQPRQVERFASLYLRHQDDMPTFWSNLEAELGKATTQRLRLDGQLGYLTLNHAPLIRSLHHAEQKKPLTSTLDLAKRGYYEAGKWLSLLDGAIPPHIPGETDAEKREKYAELLAAQVRLAFPTAVIAERVQCGDIPIPKAHGVAKGVYSFLTKHQGQFEIGVEPVERYLARHGLKEEKPVVTQIKRLQRVHQITPNDQALAELLKPEHELDSAYAITRRHDQESFVRTFGEALGEETARQTYAKAVQVHGAVLNIATSYLTARIAPPLGALPLGANQQSRVLDAAPVAPRDGSSGVIAYPTLEGLFGSMDYCPCDECRSILSPAAYLVDLLHFTDRPPLPQSSFRNPQVVLFERRPDLQYLALTCENTNVKLPYIDLVNETLEYIVASGYGMFNHYEGHDTDGSVSSDELMANPQFVNDLAYEWLKWTHFPLQLPFHRPLELLRLHFQQSGVKLQDAIAVLTPAPTIRSWWNVLIEEIGFSDQEARLLIQERSVDVGDLYGYPSDLPAADLIDQLSNVQNFSRRMGISYDDLIAILQTKFINPKAVLIPRLRRLGVPFRTLHALKDGSMTDEQFKALLPADLDARKYGGSDVKDLQAVVNWVTTNYDRITKIIVIDVPTSVDPTDPNSVASLKFCFCDPATSKLHKIEFVCLMRFIRLWKKLGLTIAQTDDIMSALYPPSALPTGEDEEDDFRWLGSGFFRLLERIGFLLQIMRRLNLNADRDLAPLLACWASIGTTGEHSLYAKMFLTPAVLSQDPAFADDGYGNILQDETQLLLDHAPALRAAFGLRDAEFTTITTALSFNESTLLTLENISAIYRRGWLARTLRLSVVELLHLTRFTGLDPFALLGPADTEPSEPPVIRLIRLLQKLSAVSFKPVQALYLIWAQDINDKLWEPLFSTGITLARTLRASLTDVESQFSLGDDPSGDTAKARMALVYGAAATDLFFGILNKTVEDHKTKDRFFDSYPELREFYQQYTASNDPPQIKRAALLDALLRDIKQNRKREQALAAVTAAAGTDPSFAAALLNDASVLHTVKDTTLPAIRDLTAIEAGGLYGQFYLTNDFHVPPGLLVTCAPLLDYAPGGDNPLPRNPNGGPIGGRWSGYLDVPKTDFYDIAITTDPGATARYIQIGEHKVRFVKTGNTWTNEVPIHLTVGDLPYFQFGFGDLTNILRVTWKSTDSPWQVIPAQYLLPETNVGRLITVYKRFLISTSLAKALSLTAREIAYLASNPDFSIVSPVTNLKDGWLNFLAQFNWGSDTEKRLGHVLSSLLDFARIKKELSPSDERFLAILQNPTATLAGGTSALLALTGWDQKSLDALLACFSYKHADLTDLEKLRRVYDAYALVKTCGTSAATVIAAATNDPAPKTVTALQAALRAKYAEADWLAVIKPINDTMRVKQRDALVAFVLKKCGDQDLTAHINTPDKLFELLLMDVEMEPCMATSRIRHALSSVQLFIERCVRNLEPDVSPADIDATQWQWMKRYRVWQANREVFLWPENWLDPELREDQSPFFKEAMSELLQSDITDDAAQSAFLNYLTKLDEVAKLEPCGLYTAKPVGYDLTQDSYVVARTVGAHRKYYFRSYKRYKWTPWQQIKLDIEDVPITPYIWKDRLFLFWLKTVQQPTNNVITSQQGFPSQQGSEDTRTLANSTFSDVLSKTKDSGTMNPAWQAAILCWSEYYNGAWQPIKMSDPNHPTSIFCLNATESWPYARSIMPLFVGELGILLPWDPVNQSMPSDTLVIEAELDRSPDIDARGNAYIFYGTNTFGWLFARGRSAFTLNNTNSLPVRAEDYKARQYTPPMGLVRRFDRVYGYGDYSPDFGIWQWSDNGLSWHDIILKTKRSYRITEPQPYLYTKYTPFFFMDNQNVFYVSLSSQLVTIPDYNYFGAACQGAVPAKTVMIPPLVSPSTTTVQSRDGPVTPSPRSCSESGNIRQSVAQDSDSRIARSVRFTIRYGKREIG